MEEHQTHSHHRSSFTKISYLSLLANKRIQKIQVSSIHYNQIALDMIITVHDE